MTSQQIEAAQGRLPEDLAELERLAPVRLAWSREWQIACDWLSEKARAAGADFEVDRAGNHWFTLRGDGDGSVVLGGHIDTAADGSGLGGSLSLLLGLEVIRRVRARGRPPVAVRLVNWVDGMGARFGRPFGVSAAAGRLRDWYEAEELLDATGVSLREVAQSFGIEPRFAHMARRLALGTRAYVEVGFDACPDRATLSFAVASAVGGIERCRISWNQQVEGAPPGRTGDPEAAADRFARMLPELAGAGSSGNSCQMGGLRSLSSGSRVEQVVDLRQAAPESLEALLELALDTSDQIAREERLSVEWRRLWRAPPAAFDSSLAVLASEAVSGHGAVASLEATGLQCGAAELARSGTRSALLLLRADEAALRASGTDLELAARIVTELVEKTVAEPRRA